tara:strand:+ start:352 stop:468 length:117 start_codon:yes stop_codon:yes gene_type:complete
MVLPPEIGSMPSEFFEGLAYKSGTMALKLLGEFFFIQP